MFKENRFIFEQAESVPSSIRRKRLSFGPRRAYNGGELPREIKEKEKAEKEDNIRVAEKLINNIETFGVKCPRCGSKNVSEIATAPQNKKMLYCFDCKNKWEATES